jgi:Fe-S cluster biogenesis protein NfuA/nitrite reductase/ring-hydroxylating ferredoxin subunit
MAEHQSIQQRMQRVEGLVRKIENLSDENAKSSALELMQSLMEFHGAGLERMMDIVAESKAGGFAVFDEFAADEVVGSLLLLYGLHPLTLEQRVMQGLAKVRPYLDSHGGDVELLSTEDGVVRLRMQGSCKSCPSSAMTLKLAIEEAIYAAAPDVVAIEAENVTEQKAAGGGLVQIGVGRNGGNGHGAAQGNGHGTKGWEEVAELETLAPRSVELREIGGRSILFCRLGESFYAYGNNCPGCEQPLLGAELQLTSLICPNCKQEYDLIRAGRGLDQPNLHLEPFPLLMEQGKVRVALPPN